MRILEEEYRRFLARQEETLARDFSPALLLRQGAVPSEKVTTGLCGYSVYLRHNPSIVSSIAAFSKRITSVAPTMLYDAANIHTSVVVWGRGTSYNATDRNLREILEGVTVCLEEMYDPISLDFGDKRNWVFNSDAVLVAAGPNKAYVALFTALCSAIAPRATLFPPFGSYVTVARFTEQRSPQALKAFVELMNDPPSIGISRPTLLEAGYWEFKEQQFTLRAHTQFPLRK